MAITNPETREKHIVDVRKAIQDDTITSYIPIIAFNIIKLTVFDKCCTSSKVFFIGIQNARQDADKRVSVALDVTTWLRRRQA